MDRRTTYEKNNYNYSNIRCDIIVLKLKINNILNISKKSFENKWKSHMSVMNQGWGNNKEYEMLLK